MKKYGTTYDISSNSWLCDVLECVDKIPYDEFELNDVYLYEEHLHSLHPDNNNIKAKIRQQLQYLRDAGYIEFLDRGHYRKTGQNETNKKYKIIIEETVSGEFEVTAESEEEAKAIAARKYKDGEFVLEPGELEEVRFLSEKDLKE